MNNSINKLLKRIKHLFVKAPSQADTKTNIKRPSNTDGKAVINESSYSQEQKDIFDRLQTGDLVYSWMPLSDEELEKVPEGHRFRPYYVVCKYEDYVDVCMCTSTPIEKDNEFTFYMLSNYTYENLTKESYLDLKHIYKLPIDCLINYLGHVTGNDFNEINKRLYKCNNGAFVKRYGKNDKYKKPTVGDIVMKNGLHLLVVADIGKYYRVIRIRPKDNGSGDGFYVKVGKTNWKVLKKDGYRMFLEKEQSSKIYHTLNKGEFSKVRKYLDSFGGTYCIPKGFIFRIGKDKYYYSYGTYNNKTQAYYVYANERRDSCQIVECDNIPYSIDKRKQEVISDFPSVKCILYVN